jgi:hypothetical protein
MTPSSKVPDEILGVGEDRKKESSTSNEVTPMTRSSKVPDQILGVGEDRKKESSTSNVVR